MSRNFFVYILFFQFSASLIIAQTKKHEKTHKKPKLVIGIVVDQMRNDYISRYWDRFGNGGFKKLVNQGYYFKNTHYNYIPTYTGPGHASVYTGTTPRFHGIIANDWYVKSTNSKLYCVQDTNVQTVGASGKNGKMSPINLLSSTIGDELKVNTNQKTKVFSVALKDRSAILPAGHAADAAFWFDDASGNFISSTWYMNQLPAWLIQFNQNTYCKSYLQKSWNTLYPIETYSNSIHDINEYEEAPGKMPAHFPYDYSTFLEKSNYSIIKATPYGNSITKDLAIACIQNEKLGKGAETDFLSISFSSTDYIGHYFGIRSIEIEDTYLRLDKELESFLIFLDRELGVENYMLFLTADHGAAETPLFLSDRKIPSGIIHEADIEQQLKKLLFKKYQDSLILQNVSNQQIFLNHDLLQKKNIKEHQLENELITYLLNIPGVAEVYTADVIKFGSFDKQEPGALLQNGFSHKLSGDICFLYQPGWIDHDTKGTTHGSGYIYDTHVPLLFYGNGIKKGVSNSYTSITQIAPTVCEYLKISRPNGCFSEPLTKLLK